MDNLIEKVLQIKLIAFDVDGVLTNGEIIYTDKGDELKIFDAKDGQGICMLRAEGFITAIITARSSSIIERRARDLDILHIYQGIKNKLNAIEDLMSLYKLDFSQIAYIGDDIPDICILKKVGLSFCPADAVEEVKKICSFISTKQGGKGAVREISDFILTNKKSSVTLNMLKTN
ncbi:MAG: HAD-IIIA family hydrolase [bacterium]